MERLLSWNIEIIRENSVTIWDAASEKSFPEAKINRWQSECKRSQTCAGAQCRCNASMLPWVSDALSELLASDARAGGSARVLCGAFIAAVDAVAATTRRTGGCMRASRCNAHAAHGWDQNDSYDANHCCTQGKHSISEKRWISKSIIPTWIIENSNCYPTKKVHGGIGTTIVESQFHYENDSGNKIPLSFFIPRSSP